MNTPNKNAVNFVVPGIEPHWTSSDIGFAFVRQKDWEGEGFSSGNRCVRSTPKNGISKSIRPRVATRSGTLRHRGCVGSELSRGRSSDSRVHVASSGVLCLLIGLFWTFDLCAQSPEEHARHHPGQAGGGAPAAGAMPVASPGAAGGMGGGMEGMEKMMEGIGKAAPKELYPSLMSFPELTPEQREQVRSQADERMRSGVALLSEGLDRLGAATENENYPAMQEATAQVREALGQFESGLAARRALAEGKPPRQVALQWFKSEMNLPPPQGSERRGHLSGATLLHLFTMVLLIAFALAMVAMYFFKMRRAAALFERIETDAGSPPPGSAPPLVGTAPPAATAPQGTSV